MATFAAVGILMADDDKERWLHSSRWLLSGCCNCSYLISDRPDHLMPLIGIKWCLLVTLKTLTKKKEKISTHSDGIRKFILRKAVLCSLLRTSVYIQFISRVLNYCQIQTFIPERVFLCLMCDLSSILPPRNIH